MVENILDNPSLLKSLKSFTKNKKTSSLTYNNSSKTKNSEGEMSPYRSLLIRTICAVAIFLTVVTICSLDGKYGTDHTSSIETMITNNISLEQTQDFFVSIRTFVLHNPLNAVDQKVY